MELNIGHLYPDLLNIYGDRGNIICLINRCRWRGIKVRVTPVSLGFKLNKNQFDFYFGGGGQDRQQLIVAKDLQTKKTVLRFEANRGVPILAICGTYQLFGHFFKTKEANKIPGISIFDAYTQADNKRKIGNVLLKTFIFKGQKTATLVGFENHSGNTFLNPKSDTKPLGVITKGFGNNGSDKTEGAIYKNVFGTYLHGPILPKNPHLADLLISLALEKKYKKIKLQSLNDRLEWQAHQAAVKRTYQSG